MRDKADWNAAGKLAARSAIPSRDEMTGERSHGAQA